MEKLEACESASRGLEAERSGKGMGVQPACVVRSRVPDGDARCRVCESIESCESIELFEPLILSNLTSWSRGSGMGAGSRGAAPPPAPHTSHETRPPRREREDTFEMLRCGAGRSPPRAPRHDRRKIWKFAASDYKLSNILYNSTSVPAPSIQERQCKSDAHTTVLIII